MRRIVSSLIAIAFIASMAMPASASVRVASWAKPDAIKARGSARVTKGEAKEMAWFDSRPASFADLAEEVGSAVVNISTTKRMGSPRMGRRSPRFGPRDPFDNFFDKFFEGQPRQREQHSLGSGFIVSNDGTILTNSHVVSQSDEVQVELSDGRKFKAELIGMDERTDIAVIKIKGNGELPTVKLGNSDKMRAGDWVMAIGNPFGLEQTVTVGVVSAMGRIMSGGPLAKFIQTDASINPGNSGGPLFNLKGEVVGINTMIYAGGQGIGFAIPVNLVKNVMPQLLKTGKVERGWLGVYIQAITPELAKAFKLKTEEGALIAEVYQGSPAAKAGFRSGDVIIEFNGKKVESPTDLSIAVGNTKAGVASKVKVVRGGKEEELEVTIGEYDQDAVAVGKDVPGVPGRGKADLLGLVVKQITPMEATRLDLPADFKGVVVQRVEPHSSSARSEVRSGDVLLEVNGKKIKTLEAYRATSKDIKEGDYVRMLIKRGSASIYLAFKVTK